MMNVRHAGRKPAVGDFDRDRNVGGQFEQQSAQIEFARPRILPVFPRRED